MVCLSVSCKCKITKALHIFLHLFLVHHFFFFSLAVCEMNRAPFIFRWFRQFCYTMREFKRWISACACGCVFLCVYVCMSRLNALAESILFSTFQQKAIFRLGTLIHINNYCLWSVGTPLRVTAAQSNCKWEKPKQKTKRAKFRFINDRKKG